VGPASRGVVKITSVAAIHEIQIRGETIRLGQLLKLSGIAESGGASKALLLDGVRVNGVAETRRGRQLHPGDVVEARGETARVVAVTPSAGDGAPGS
jgi:ribosome-associated protein